MEKSDAMNILDEYEILILIKNRLQTFEIKKRKKGKVAA